MQNLLTKQEPAGALIHTCMNYKRNCHLNYHMTGENWKNNKFYEISVYTKLNVGEDLEFSMHFHPIRLWIPFTFICAFNRQTKCML